MKLISGILCLLAGLIVFFNRGDNETHANDNYHYGKWIGILLFFLALIFLMPWGEKDANK